MPKHNVFQGIDDLHESYILGGFECINCHVNTKRDPTFQPYMAVSLTSYSNPEWVFY
jgi:hypothetical protein